MGYLAVLRSPAMATLTVLSFVSSFVGYSQLNAGFPAYARAVGEVSTRALGLAFAANTLVIVVLQLVVLQRIEGRRRTRVIAVMGVVWAFSWLLLGFSGLVPGTLGAALLVAACASVFAFGETLLQPTIPALVNDLAPDHLRGRYNAVSSGSFQLAAVIAPPISGLLIGHALGDVYIGLLVVGSLLCGLIAIAWLEPRLDPTVNGVREDETAADGEITPPVVSPVDDHRSSARAPTRSRLAVKDRASPVRCAAPAASLTASLARSGDTAHTAGFAAPLHCAGTSGGCGPQIDRPRRSTCRPRIRRPAWAERVQSACLGARRRGRPPRAAAGHNAIRTTIATMTTRTARPCFQ